MRFTLYVQYKKGRRVYKPKGIEDVTIHTEPNRTVCAFKDGGMVIEPLQYHDIQLRLDGICILGIEETPTCNPGTGTFHYQEWWLVPAQNQH